MDTSNLLRALQDVAGFELVEQSKSPSQLRLLGRVKPDKEAAQRWLAVVRQLLVESLQASWKVDISKHFFLASGVVLYGWRLIFQAPAIEAELPNIIVSVAVAPRAGKEVTEMPLGGATAHRNVPASGHGGAGYIGQMPIGPQAMLARQMGLG